MAIFKYSIYMYEISLHAELQLPFIFCASPDGNLRFGTSDEAGDVMATLLSWSKKKAHIPILLNKK